MSASDPAPPTHYDASAAPGNGHVQLPTTDSETSGPDAK
jgi:hypothetical protein